MCFSLQGVHPSNRVYKLVLTGGPCGGKTTGQAKVASFFEGLGWKVFRVPETATVLMSGGIAFGELTEEQVLDFQVSACGRSLTDERSLADRLEHRFPDALPPHSSSFDLIYGTPLSLVPLSVDVQQMRDERRLIHNDTRFPQGDLVHS